MSKTQRKADEAIDAFVKRVNRSSRQPLSHDEVPQVLRDGEPTDAEGYWVPWAIRPAPSPCAWIDAFEAKLPGRIPRSYRSLVTRYQFPSFRVGPMLLFANTGGAVHEASELVRAVFDDNPLCTPLLPTTVPGAGAPRSRATGAVANDRRHAPVAERDLRRDAGDDVESDDDDAQFAGDHVAAAQISREDGAP